MGTKFANLHFITEDIGQLIEVLNSTSNEDISLSRYYLGSFNFGIVSVFEEEFNWESILDVALNISKYLDNPILSIGYFDDDILEITLVKNNKVITKHVTGESLEMFGMESQEIDTKVLNELLNMGKENELSDVFGSSDIEEIINKLEEVIQTSIWNKFDWIEEEEDDVKSRFQYFEKNKNK